MHGLSNHRLFVTWKNMISRTSNGKDVAYKNYGGRGITVCNEWLEPKNFIDDMYPSFIEGTTLDRIDNNKGYSKENCTWSTREAQARNTRVLKSSNTSGYRGVVFIKSTKKWRAGIYVSGKLIFLGYFNTAIKAAMVYDKFVIDNNLQHNINGVSYDS